MVKWFNGKKKLDYFDTYTLVSKITTIKKLISIIAVHNLTIHQMDIRLPT